MPSLLSTTSPALFPARLMITSLPAAEMLDRFLSALSAIAVVLVFTCLSSSTRLADTLLACLIYVPSTLRLPILLSTFVILVFAVIISSALAFTWVSSLVRFSATFLPASIYVPPAIVPILLSTAVIAPSLAFTCTSSAEIFSFTFLLVLT